MNLKAQNILKTNELYLRYLRENSRWYKILNRNGEEDVTKMIEEMKERYKMRPTDKINNLIDSIDLINSFMQNMK